MADSPGECLHTVTKREEVRWAICLTPFQSLDQGAYHNASIAILHSVEDWKGAFYTQLEGITRITASNKGLYDLLQCLVAKPPDDKLGHSLIFIRPCPGD